MEQSFQMLVQAHSGEWASMIAVIGVAAGVAAWWAVALYLKYNALG